MGSFFFDPSFYGSPAAGMSDLERQLLRQQYGHLFAPAPEPQPGGTFGPIAGPVEIPPLFGPISGGGSMPFDLGPNITGLASNLLGLFAGRRNAFQPQGFMPGSPQVILPPVEILRQAPVTRTPQLMQGRVVQGGGCACTIQRQLPARTVNMKGTPVIDPATNQIIGCTPRRKRMNFMNGRAAVRAARRLVGVMRFQKKIQKAVGKACRGRGGSGGFRRTSKARSCK
jgi:hypothetical protein